MHVDQVRRMRGVRLLPDDVEAELHTLVTRDDVDLIAHALGCDEHLLDRVLVDHSVGDEAVLAQREGALSKGIVDLALVQSSSGLEKP